MVLTAAHCVDFIVPDEEFDEKGFGLPLSDLRVVVGRAQLSSDLGQRRGAVGISVHPAWIGQEHGLSGDVAVIYLDEPVTDIEPVRLVTPGTDALERPGRKATVTGWGNTILQPVGPGPGGGLFERPDRLQAAKVPLVSDEECHEAYANTLFEQWLDPSMICAGRTGLDACNGDSGGPLFVETLHGGAIQIGVTSWGFGCGATGFPGVFTRLGNVDIGNFVQEAVGGVPVPAQAAA